MTEIGSMPIRSSTASNQEGKDFKVVITIDKPSSNLRVGMSCEAKITVGSHKDALAVPIQALTRRDVKVDAKGQYIPPPKPEKAAKGLKSAGAAQAKEPKGKEPKDKTKEMDGVFVLGADGMSHFRPVKAGLMGELKVEITEGLKEGEEVIIGPLKALRTLDDWKLIKKSDLIKDDLPKE